MAAKALRAGLLVICTFAPGAIASAADSAALVEGAHKEGKLVIYSLLAVPDHSRIVNHFRERYPFLEVSLARPGASERIGTRVVTEARAGRHLVDVIGVSRLNMMSLIQRGLIASYDRRSARASIQPSKTPKAIGLPFTSIRK